MGIFANIHRIASSVIPRETVMYRTFLSSSINSIGNRSPSYNEWISIKAHVQPGMITAFGSRALSEKDYKQNGLDFSRNYITIWCDGVNISTVNGKEFPDQFKVGDRTYNVIQIADWLAYSGWKQIYCVEDNR